MTDKPKSKRRNMKSFKLEEISVVDKPAQEGAKMAIMKRKDDALSTRILKHYLDSENFAADVASSVIKSAGVKKAGECLPGIAAVTTSLQSVLRDHSLSDVKKVDMMKSSVEDFVTFTKERLPDAESHLLKAVSTGDQEMNLRQLQKQMTALSNKLDSALTRIEKSAKDDETKTSARLREALEKNEVDKAEDEEMPPFMAETEKAEEEMPPFMETEKAEDDEEYEYPVDEDTEKSDDPENEKPTSEGEEEEPIAAGSARPIGGGAGGKRAAKKRNAAEDDVLQIGKHTIRKSAVGGDLFEIIKAQQDAVDRLAKQAQDERDLREVVEFAKVAEDELSHLPGKVEEKAMLLKRLSDVLERDDRAVLSRMLKAGNAGVGAAFNTIGHKVNKAAAASTDFTKRANEIRARDNCSRTEAMRKARLEHPEAFAAYQDN
jgi:hypothetical protein